MCSYCHQPYCNNGSACGWNRPNYNPPYTQPFVKSCSPYSPPVPQPECQSCQSCFADGCLQSITTDCVFTVSPYTCINTGPNTSLTTILSKIDALLCSAPSSSCQIKVTAADNCCGYLGSKITSSSLIITTPTNDTTGCTTLNMEVPSLSCLSKIKVNSADVCCDYLSNKIISDSLTITEVTGEGGCVQLQIETPNLACLGKVLVSSLDTTCDYLGNKILPAAIYPVSTGPGNQTLTFQKQYMTFLYRPGLITPNDICTTNPQRSILAGTVYPFTETVSTPWSGPSTAPVINAGAGTITLTAGVYDISVNGQLSFNSSGALTPVSGYLLLGIVHTNVVYLQAFAPITCPTQYVMIFGGTAKALTVSTTTTYNITLYSTLTNNGTGAAETFTPASTDGIYMTIEKVG